MTGRASRTPEGAAPRPSLERWAQDSAPMYAQEIALYALKVEAERDELRAGFNVLAGYAGIGIDEPPVEVVAFFRNLHGVG